MFGWLKRRERFEHIKLLKQNELAAQYLQGFAENAAELGDPVARAMADELHLVGFSVRQVLSSMQSHRILSQDKFSEQWELQKQLRRLYDENLEGRKLFAKQFGSASEKLEKFDAKFQPNEGWKIFVEHFGESFEDTLRGHFK